VSSIDDWFRQVNELLHGWAPSLAVLVAGAVFGWIAKTWLFRRLRSLADKTATHADEMLLDATRRSWFPIAVFLALHAAAPMAPIEPQIRVVLQRIASFLLLLAVTFAAARFVGLWFSSKERTEEGLPAAPSLIAKASRISVLLIGLMFAMQNAGFEIGPLLTALGVGSLAVGLALQPTLSNFFAGIHLSMSKPIRIGDFIELEDGTQGEVVDITWRTTKIRQLGNNLVIVPNARISDMRLLNYSMPESPQSVIIPLGVAYGSDLERVEAVCIDVARSVLHDLPEESQLDFDPLVRFHTFADSSINFNVILRARRMTDRFALIHAFAKRIKKRFDAEGIEIPFPQRVVHLPAAPASEQNETS